MFRLKELEILGSKAELAALPEGKLLINTINAHSYNTAHKDKLFAEALTNGDVLIPDGVSIVKACKWIKAKSQPKERIAGWDLFSFEMAKLERESEERRVKSEESSADNDNQVEGKSKIDNSSSASADNSCLGKRLYEPSATPNPQHSTFINSSSASADNSCLGKRLYEPSATPNPQHSTFINSSSASADNSCLGKRLYEPSATPNPQHSTFINSSSASADNSCLGKRLYEPSATPNLQHSTFINSSSASADNSTFNPQHSTFRSPQRTVMFMGSSQKVLDLIVKRAAEVYPHLKVVTYSPPYKPEFSDDDNKAIIDAINAADPDLLWIGMTAPKQEKWTYSHWDELNIHCHVGTIGAVFDFFAGTVERAPMWWQRHGLEWLYRLLKEPKRMWRRYIIGNALFLWNMLKEKC